MSKQIGKAVMSDELRALLKPPGQDRGNDFTIFGSGGTGKTLMSSYFPRPVIIPVEDGTEVLKGRQDVLIFEKVKSTQEILNYIKLLGTTEHDRKTLIIDSISELHDLIENEIIEEDGKASSIATAMGGYGKGYKAAARRHKQIKDYCDKLKELKKMNIVYIAHADITQYTPPDEEAYNVYTLRIHKDSLPIYTEKVDCVAQIKLETFVVGDDGKKKAHSTNNRSLVCHTVASSITKNRFDIEQELPVKKHTNPLVKYLGTYEAPENLKESK
jgi:phage nucleotide-binding protein